MNPVIKVLSFIVIISAILYLSKSCSDNPLNEEVVENDTPKEAQSDQDNASEAVIAVGTEIKGVKDIQRKLTNDTKELKVKTNSIKENLNSLSNKLDRLIEEATLYDSNKKDISFAGHEGLGLDLLDVTSSKSSIELSAKNRSEEIRSVKFVWYPMDIAFAEATLDINHFDTNVLSDRSVYATPPTYVIPSGTLIQGKTLTGLIGRIPINGRVVDPWRFKIVAKGMAYAPNHKQIDVSGMIFEGVAQGDYSFKCTRGRINKATIVLPDNSVITLKGEEDSIIAWISDDNSNPCLTGQYVSNVRDTLGRSTVFSALKGVADSISASEQTKTVSADGVQRSIVTGDSLRVTGADALSSIAKQANTFISQRSDTWDAIYVTAGQNVMIHISTELVFDISKKRELYDKQKIANYNVKRLSNNLD